MDAAREALAALTRSEREEFLVEMLAQLATEIETAEASKPTIRVIVVEVLRDGTPRPMGDLVDRVSERMPGSRPNSIRATIAKLASAGALVASGGGRRRNYTLAEGG